MNRSFNNKINILFVIVQMDIMGGSERLVHNLSLRLDPNIFNPSVLWFYGDSALDDFSKLKIPLHHVPKVKRFDISTMRGIANITNENNIHIVNAHHYMSMVYAFYGCKIMNKAKLIYTEHSTWDIKRLKWKWRTMGKYLLNHLDCMVGVNAEVTNFIKMAFKLHSSKAIIIANGVDIQAFSSKTARSEKKRELGIANKDNVLGIVANLRKIKNHIFLLKAFESLIKKVQNVKLLIIGQGFGDHSADSEAEIRKFITNKCLEKKVLLLGYRSDIPELLNIMDIFCLTSFKEGLPISLIEAMAAGLPLVGTDVGGIRDVIVPNRNGFLVQLGDITGLKNVLVNLLQNEELRNKMGQESLALANQYYSLDHCVNQYQDLFMSVMNK